MPKDVRHDDPNDLPREVTPGGSEVFRHEPSMNEDEVDCTFLDEAQMDAIQAHFTEHIGEFEDVMHELMSEGVHLDMLATHVEDEEPFTVVATMGMSAVPMAMPAMELEEGEDESALPSPYAEVFMVLPGKWPISGDELEDENNWWPYRVLKDCGRIPVMFDSFLGAGHTVPNGDPAEPYAPACPFTGVLILPGGLFNEDFAMLVHGDRRTEFLMVIPLFPEEMDHKLEHGVDSLIGLFEQAEISPLDLADPARPNVCV